MNENTETETAWTPGQIAAGLREVARRLNPFQAKMANAAVELLIRHETWVEALAEPDEPRSENSIARFAKKNRGHEGEPLVAVNWASLVDHLDRDLHTYSFTEVNILKLAASLYQGIPVNMQRVLSRLDRPHAEMILDAITAAAGFESGLREATR